MRKCRSTSCKALLIWMMLGLICLISISRPHIMKLASDRVQDQTHVGKDQWQAVKNQKHGVEHQRHGVCGQSLRIGDQRGDFSLKYDSANPGDSILFDHRHTVHDRNLSAHRHAADDRHVADELASSVRVLCWILTSPKTLHSRAVHVRDTWGKRCSTLLLMSSQPDLNVTVVPLKVKEGRVHLWSKTKAAFQYIYKHYITEADWFLKADDDTYVIMENLRWLLKGQNTSQPLYFGRRLHLWRRNGEFMSGGAGYVLSKEALHRLITRALPDTNNCYAPRDGAEDVTLARCLRHVGVQAGESRDNQHRETFHPLNPELHINPKGIVRSSWYWRQSFYPAKEGPECCSNYTISFHYVSADMMHVLEFLIYQLRPYGVGVRYD